MKYIRTESGIYELFSSNSRSSKFLYPTKKGHRLCQRENWRCRFADTIEELCDEYCLKGSDGTRLVYNRSDFADLKKDILSNDGWTEIYGTIWTKKGLIYVAKMNDKGELELC